MAQLGPEEVILLEAMCNKTNPETVGKVGNILDIYGGGVAFPGKPLLSEFHSVSVDSNSGVDELGRYTLITITSVRDYNNDPRTFQTGSYLHENSIFWLERLGLVKVISNIDCESDRYDYFAFKAQLTPLGYSFVNACKGIKRNNSQTIS